MKKRQLNGEQAMWKLLLILTCVFIAACDDDRPPPWATGNSIIGMGLGLASTLKFGSRRGVATMKWVGGSPRDFTEHKGKLADGGRFGALNVGAPQYVDWSVFEGAWISSLVLEPIRCDVSTYGYIKDRDSCKRAEQSFLPPEAFEILPTINGLKFVLFRLNRQDLDDNFYRRLSEFIVTNPQVGVSFEFFPGKFDFCRLRIAGAKQHMEFLHTSLTLPDEAYRMAPVPRGEGMPRQLGDVFYDPWKGNITRNAIREMEDYIYQRPYSISLSHIRYGEKIYSRGSGNKALWDYNCADPG